MEFKVRLRNPDLTKSEIPRKSKIVNIQIDKPEIPPKPARLFK